MFRENLAEQLKDEPKDERKEILEQAKENPEYWEARNKNIEGRQEEQEIENGLGVFVKKRTLYHGTTVGGIKNFNKAEEATVGEGLYLTSKVKDAIGYSYVRTRHRTSSKNKEEVKPIVYEVSVENLKLLDFRKDENIKKVLKGFIPILKEKASDESLKYYYRNALKEAAISIWAGKVKSGNVAEVASHIGQDFTDYIESLGWDGLITFEGGEGDEVKNHDTYLIFNPKKVKVGKEQKIENKK